ncbi:MAG: CPXCG motif-containing cysteine-rich protein [Rhodanobacteraceae bacterium]
MLESIPVVCPYCGESIELSVDASAGSTAYIEDCPVCCQPMQVDVEVNGAAISARVKTCDE